MDYNNEQNKETKHDLSAQLKFIIFRMIFIVVLTFTLTVIKFVFNNIFNDIMTFYNNNISVNITADYFDSIGGTNSND